MPHMFYLRQYKDQGIKTLDINAELVQTPAALG